MQSRATNRHMQVKYTRLLCLLLVLMVALQRTESSASFKKIPFNGSMYGKRTTPSEYELSRALSAVCEAAAEACSAWGAQADK